MNLLTAEAAKKKGEKEPEKRISSQIQIKQNNENEQSFCAKPKVNA